MIRRPRVLLIGRNFWPHGSIDSAAFLFQLACAMHRCGVHVEVMSPRYASSWPEQLTIRELLVHRPAAAPRSEWSMGRYVRHVTTWLRQNGRGYDVLLVDAIREEATAAIEAARTLGCPVVLRLGGWGPASDAVWWRTSRSARKCGDVGRMADAIIAKSAACQRALIAEGYPAARIHRIDQGFSASPITSQSRSMARQTLAAVNGDLAVEDDAAVLLCRCRMTRDSGVNLLVKSARHVIARNPKLRLWLIGDGPRRDRIYETLRGDGLRAWIAMPGSFCDGDELLAAADLFFQADEDGLDYFLPAAISAELPLILVDNDSTRTVITGPTGSGRWLRPDTGASGGPVAVQDPSRLAEWVSAATARAVGDAIDRALDDLPTCRAKASQLRRTLVRDRPQSETIKAYVSLLEQVVRDNTTRRQRPSIEAV